jgi:hypothetical protein
LAGYIESLREGDLAGVLERYHGTTDFYLPHPIPIKEYKIVKKITYGTKEVEDWNQKGVVPPAELGDVELQVRETIDGKEQIFFYNLRRVRGSWKIIAHSAEGID